jgi:hypothetical protein
MRKPTVHSESRRASVIRLRTSRALAPAAAASFRSRRNGSFWPSRSSSVIDTGGAVARRRHPFGMLRCGGRASSGAWYTTIREPSGVSVAQPQTQRQRSSVYDNSQRGACRTNLQPSGVCTSLPLLRAAGPLIKSRESRYLTLRFRRSRAGRAEPRNPGARGCRRYLRHSSATRNG